MREEALEVLNKFDSALEDLISEYLYESVTPEEVNEYYGTIKDCQIAEILRDLKRRLKAMEELIELLKRKGG